MKNRLIGAIVLFCCIINVQAQLRYPIVGTYKKKSAQGMAIYGYQAYLFSDGGLCRVYDFNNSKVVNEFKLSTSAPTNHVNNACFGIELGSYNQIPFIYITECKNKFRCFVEEILPDTTRLVQTISATNNGKPERVLVWAIDREHGLLYSVTRSDKTLKSQGYSQNTITEYKLPNVSDGDEVVLREKDVLKRYVVQFPNILQGAKISKGKLYIVTGLQQSASHRLDAQRAIQVIDLKKGVLVKTIDLTYLTTNEPEDIDFYKGKALLYCGQEGGIYEIKL